MRLKARLLRRMLKNSDIERRCIMQTTFSRPSARKLALILIAVLPALLAATAMLVLLATTVTAHEPGYEEKAWSLQNVVTVNGTIASGEWTTDTSQVVVDGLTDNGNNRHRRSTCV